MKNTIIPVLRPAVVGGELTTSCDQDLCWFSPSVYYTISLPLQGFIEKYSLLNFSQSFKCKMTKYMSEKQIWWLCKHVPSSVCVFDIYYENDFMLKIRIYEKDFTL